MIIIIHICDQGHHYRPNHCK